MLQIVIPAYNEEARLPRTLRDAAPLRRARSGACSARSRCIVVDNASTDATAEVARAADSPALPVRVVRCATAARAPPSAPACRQRRRRGRASWTPTAPPTSTRSTRPGCCLAPRGRRRDRFPRRSRARSTETRHSRVRAAGAARLPRASPAVVPGIADTQCGFKLMRGGLARAVFARPAHRRLLLRRRAAGPGCSAVGARIDEIPVTWTDVPGLHLRAGPPRRRRVRRAAAIAWRTRVAPVAAAGSRGHPLPPRRLPCRRCPRAAAAGGLTCAARALHCRPAGASSSTGATPALAGRWLGDLRLGVRPRAACGGAEVEFLTAREPGQAAPRSATASSSGAAAALHVLRPHRAPAARRGGAGSTR